EEELGETLRRAREIAAHGERADHEAAYEGYVRAAEEMGISREAVLQALCERLLIPAEQFAAGHTVFAPSMDGCWYLAEILSTGDLVASVRFLSGGERTVPLADLRPASLVPGRRLQADCKDW